MSDIIERLRGRAPYDGYSWDIAQEGAAEIERLRAALLTIRNGSVSGHIEYVPLSEFIDAALEPKP